MNEKRSLPARRYWIISNRGVNQLCCIALGPEGTAPSINCQPLPMSPSPISARATQYVDRDTDCDDENRNNQNNDDACECACVIR